MDKNNRDKTEQVFGKNSVEIGENFQAEAATADSDKQERNVINRQITEEQARLLLEQDKFETEQRMKNASTHKKKVLTLVIGAVIFLVVIGVAMWLIVENKKAESGAEVGNNGGTVADEVIDKAGGVKESELVELSLDDELVQRLYEPFAVITDTYWSPFYNDELFSYGGDEEYSQWGKRRGRLSIAFLNSPHEICKATLENGGLVKRYGDFISTNWTAQQLEEVVFKCVSGENVRQNFKEIFGYSIELTGVDNYRNEDNIEIEHADSVFTMAYSPTYDEFYDSLGGAGMPSFYRRRLSKAEKDSGHLYLYEQAMVLSCGFGAEDSGQHICHVGEVGGGHSDDEMAVVEGPTEDVEEILKSDEIFDKVNDLGLIKWTFRKTDVGNYVFESLEKV